MTVPNKRKSERTLADQARVYFYVHSTSLPRYGLEQILFACLSWIPSLPGIALRALGYKLLLKSKGFQVFEESVSIKRPGDIHLGHGVYVGRHSHLWGTPEGLYIGDHTRIMHGAYLNVNNYGQFTKSPQDDENVPSKIEIGACSVIGAFACILGYGHVQIGNHVTVSNHCSIFGYDHLFSDPQERIMDQGVEKKRTVVEDDVWIGANSVLLAGTTVGRGSVIGAGSVVTRDIEPFTVAAGNPALPIRKRGTEKP